MDSCPGVDERVGYSHIVWGDACCPARGSKAPGSKYLPRMKFLLELFPPGSFFPAHVPSNALPLGVSVGDAARGIVMLHADEVFLKPGDSMGGVGGVLNKRNGIGADHVAAKSDTRRGISDENDLSAGRGDDDAFKIEYEVRVEEPLDDLDEFRCAECSDGWSDCTRCRAHGFLLCELCDGRGVFVCPGCRDRGYLFDEVPGITRHTVLSEIDPQADRTAASISKPGQKIALRQHFAANIPVKLDRRTCELCWGEPYGCPSCAGLGRIRCPKCAGTKETHCPFCQGQPGLGRVVS